MSAAKLSFGSGVRLTRRMHHAAYNEATDSTGSQVQTGALFHIKMTNQATLSEEVCGKLNRAAKSSPDHGSLHTTVETTDTLSSIDRLEAMPCAPVVVLCANGSERRETL